ncbi:MAG: hypothetical protein DRH26_00010 [Deltaproteobacteria bacterium]|nr:MAG: hypothetical protein DRH26_00010 [Deltaproteobacteria bacterium]
MQAIIESQKKCTRCNQYFTLTSEFWYKNKLSKDSFAWVCKECSKIYVKVNSDILKKKSKERRERKKDKLNAYSRGYNLEHKKELSKLNKIYLQSPAKYKTYAHKISFADRINQEKNGSLLAYCTYCNKPFHPTNTQCKNRVAALHSEIGSENRLYCSTECKLSCPVYKKIKHPNRYKKASSRETNPILRQLVFERDKWICQKCGSTGIGVTLHCHHILPATQNPMNANDPDVCMCVCKSCHKDIHKQNGCGYNDLKCYRENGKRANG